nr:hypothetical protein [Pseudomonas sp. IB20]MCV2227676.1 hypothetical protein [Pseudomonas sp. AU10]
MSGNFNQRSVGHPRLREYLSSLKNSLSGNSAAGSALPPGTYASSPCDSDKKAETAPKEKASTRVSSLKQPAS